MKGQYHKAVGFVETSEKNGNSAPKTEDSILTEAREELGNVHASESVGTDSHTTRKGEIDQKLSQLTDVRTKQGQCVTDKGELGRNSRGRKDPGVGHPPRNRVKTHWKNKDIQSMYGGWDTTPRGV